MGEAKRRGTFAERRQAAIGKEATLTQTAMPGATRSVSGELFDWKTGEKDGKRVFYRTSREPGRFTDARGREYEFDGRSVRHVRQQSASDQWGSRSSGLAALIVRLPPERGG